MNIKVYKNREVYQIDDDAYGTQNENNITVLKIEVPEQYKNWNKRIVFITKEGNFWDYIKDDTYTIKNNITKYEELEAYIWLTENAESIEESVNDFRSRTFRLSFFANENANDLVPDETQIDGFNSMLTALNIEIEEVKQINTDFTKLQQEVEQAEEERIQNEKARQESETERATAESIRKKNESDRIINENGRAEAENNRSNAEETRKANESERIANEAERKLAEENREKTTTEAINNIKDLSESYKNLANQKEKEINTLVEEKKTELENETNKNILDLRGENEDLKDDLEAFEEFEEKIFNKNAEAKTNDFDTNASTKQTEYDNNATTKIKEYNSNSIDKINEFNENAERYATELEELAQQMPWNTTEIQESIHIEDSAKYSRNKLDVFGNLKQETRSGKNKFNTKEKLNASTTKNNITYTKNADNTFDISGTASANTLINVATVTDIIQRAKSYYLYSSKKYNLATFNLSVVVKYVDGDTAYIGANKSNVTTLTDKEIKSATIDFYAAEGITVNASNVKIMLVESDTVDNEFEEYGEMPSIDYPSMPVVATGVQKIRQFGKNYFNLNDKKLVDDLFTVDTNDWISVTYNNTSGTSVKYVNYKTNSSSKIKAKTNYALFLEVKSVSGTGSVYATSNGVTKEKSQFNGNISVDFSNLSNNKIYKYTITSRDDLTATEINTMLRSFVRFEAGQSGSITFRLSVIEDTSVNTENFAYEPYKEEVFELDLGTTELCKIVDADGNVVAQDRAVYRLQEDGTYKWQWEKNVGKKILNGNEPFASMKTDKNLNYFHPSEKLSDFNYISTDTINYICSHLKCIKINDRYKDNTLFINGSQHIIITTNNFASNDELKAWLVEQYEKGVPFTFYYGAIATYEDCTAEQSAVLDKLYKLALEKGTNNIIVESENGVTTELQLTYMQDNNLIREQEHKALEDRITAIEDLLSTTQTSAMLLDNMQSDLESEV